MIGLIVDAVWHGALHPEFEAAGRRQMLSHLLAVHAVFLAGVLALLLSTGWALVERARHASAGAAWVVAFAGARVQMAGQASDAAEHLHLSNGGPVAWAMILLGPLVTTAAVLVSGAGRARPRLAQACRR